MALPTPSPARIHDFTVVSNEPVAEGVYRLTIEAPRLASALEPGQFMSFEVPGDTRQLIRIPLSYSSADAEAGTVATYYAVVGDGTRRLSAMGAGSTSTVLGPGGHGWRMDKGAKRVLVVAGGIGITPVIAAARFAADNGAEVDAVVGALTAAKICGTDELGPLCGEVRLTTDDGTAGTKGFVTAEVEPMLATGAYDLVLTCGPEPMMRAVAAIAEAAGVTCEVSVERMMTFDFGGIKMKNPINTASGTYGFGWQFEGFYDVSRLGAITTKGCAAEPWPGNPAPRMAEVTSGMMNSVGLQNPGVRGLVDSYGEYLQQLSDKGTQVICQVAGHSVDEYVRAVDLFEELAPFAAGLEINISCPNIAAGGCAMGSTPEGAAEVIRAVRSHTKRPLLVKMAPARVVEVAQALEAEGADALTVINSISGMAIDVDTRRSRLSRPTGGMSGPALHPIAVRMVWEVHNAVNIPIVGVGGVMTGRDAAEFILAGATSVSVGMANLVDPTAAPRILDELSEWAESQGVSDINELIGAFEG